MLSGKATRLAIGRALAIAIVAVIVVAGVTSVILFTSTQQATPKEIRIGITATLTGPLANIGQDQKSMWDIMWTKFNEAGGIKSLGGAKIKPIYVDDTNKPEVGRSELRRLVTEEKVHLMLLGGGSGIVAAQSEEGERLGIPMVGGIQSARVLTERGLKWYFRAWFSDREFARAQFDFFRALREKGTDIKKIALVWDTNLFGRGVRDEWLYWNKDSKLGGYEILEDIGFNTGLTDVTSEVLKLKAAKPDVLFIMANAAGDAILWQKSFKRLDFNAKAFMTTSGGHTNPDYTRALGRDGYLIYSRDAWSPDILKIKPFAAKLAEDYTAKTGKPFFTFPMIAHTSATLVADVLERAGSLEPQKIREALQKTNLKPEQIVPLWNGLRFDETGNNIAGSALIVQFIEGEWKIVYPFEYATTKAIFPQPTWAERASAGY